MTLFSNTKGKRLKLSKRRKTKQLLNETVKVFVYSLAIAKKSVDLAEKSHQHISELEESLAKEKKAASSLRQVKNDDMRDPS